MLGIYAGAADAQEEDITKEEYLDFQEQWYDHMQERGMNPGDMIDGSQINKEDFMAFQGDLFDLMQEHGISPEVKMRETICCAMMQGMQEQQMWQMNR